MKRSWLNRVVPATKADIERIIMKEQELAQQLTNLTAQLQKANTEIQAKITALTDAVNNADVPQAVTDALSGLTASAQVLDDIVPDAAPPIVPPVP